MMSESETLNTRNGTYIRNPTNDIQAQHYEEAPAAPVVDVSTNGISSSFSNRLNDFNSFLLPPSTSYIPRQDFLQNRPTNVNASMNHSTYVNSVNVPIPSVSYHRGDVGLRSSFFPPNYAETLSQSNIKINIPPFNKFQPQRWFDLLDLQFANLKITSEAIKFNTLLAKLTDEAAEYAMDEGPGTDNSSVSLTPYSNTKCRLLSAFSQNPNSCWDAIENLELGNTKPTVFLHQLLNKNRIAGMPNSRMRTIFIRAMPTDVRNILLSRQDLSLADLAKLADHMLLSMCHNNSFHPLVNALTSSKVNSPKPKPTSTTDERLIEAVTSLTNSVKQFGNRLTQLESHNFNQHIQTHSRSMPTVSSASQPQICWYHQRFGLRARKCTLPNCTMAHNSMTPSSVPSSASNSQLNANGVF